MDWHRVIRYFGSLLHRLPHKPLYAAQESIPLASIGPAGIGDCRSTEIWGEPQPEPMASPRYGRDSLLADAAGGGHQPEAGTGVNEEGFALCPRDRRIDVAILVARRVLPACAVLLYEPEARFEIQAFVRTIERMGR